MASNISDTDTNLDGAEILASFSAKGEERIELPNGDFIKNAGNHGRRSYSY